MVMVSFHHRESRKNGPIAGDTGSVSALILKKHHCKVHQVLTKCILVRADLGICGYMVVPAVPWSYRSSWLQCGISV